MPGLMARQRVCRQMGAITVAVALLLGSAGTAPATPAEALAEATSGSTELSRGNFDKALPLLEAALLETELADDQRASILNDRGVARWRLNQLKGAIDDFNEAVTLYPEFAAAYNNRGNVLLALGQTEEAIKDFDRAILLAPGYTAAINNRGVARMQLGRYEEAIVDFSRAADLAPTSPAPFNGRGRAELSLGRPYAAARSFTRSIALDPAYRPGYRNRAQVRLEVGDADEAVRDLSRALEVTPDDPGLLVALGQAEIAQKDFATALRNLDRAVEVGPNSALAYAERGYAFAKVKEFERGLADLSRSIELEPRSAAAYRYRAWTQKQLGDIVLAQADIERAMKLDPQSSDTFAVRAEINEARGEIDAALADYRQAVQLKPDQADAWAALERLSGELKPEPQEIAGAEYDAWRVFIDHAGRYFAESEAFPKLRVALEVFDAEAPRLVDWEIKTGPFKGIGVLRYRAGRLAGKTQTDEVEIGAVVDLAQQKVIGLEPYRQGKRLAVWTWDKGALSVKAPDGITSEYQLRTVKDDRFTVSRQGGDTFDSLFGFGQSSKKKTVTVQKRRKAKSLFDLLFN